MAAVQQRSTKPNRLWQEVKDLVIRLLQMLVKLHCCGMTAGNVTLDTVVMGARQELLLVDYGTSRMVGQDTWGKQLPYTLGFAAPEVVEHRQLRGAVCQKADICAVGIMGLMCLSYKQELPFGPSKLQAQRVQAQQKHAQQAQQAQQEQAQQAQQEQAQQEQQEQALQMQAAEGTQQFLGQVEAARSSVVSRQKTWAELYPATGALPEAWPTSIAHGLKSIPRSDHKAAGQLFFSLLHPDPAARPSAAEAVEALKRLGV